MAVVERRLLGLGEAEGQEGIISWRHFALAESEKSCWKIC
jgi:hypothetical protein